MTDQLELFSNNWPLDADQLGRWLYRAAEKATVAEPLSMRELADGVWHFLHDEYDQQVPTSADIVESTIKIVRELGYPQIAAALLVETSDDERFDGNTFPRNLLAAHNAGILLMGDLTVPARVAGGVFQSDSNNCQFYQFMILNVDQYLLDQNSVDFAVNEVAAILHSTRLHAIMNLNPNVSPPDPQETVSLFAQDSKTDSADIFEAGLEFVRRVNRLGDQGSKCWRWHLCSSDFNKAGANRLRKVCELAIAGPGGVFAIDRRHQPMSACHGLLPGDRVVLQTVTLNLAAMLRHVPSVKVPTEFFHHFKSVGRLVLELGHWYRRFNPSLGFHDWVLLVDVCGLPECGYKLANAAGGRTALDRFVIRAYQNLTDVLDHDEQGVSIRYGSIDGLGTVNDRTTIHLADNSTNLSSVQDAIELDPFVSRVGVRVDPNNSLAAERLSQTLRALFDIPRIRSVSVEPIR